MTTDRDRINALMMDGHLSNDEGRRILEALEHLDQRTRKSDAPATGGRPSRMAIARARFLTGEMDGETLMHETKVSAVVMGLVFTALMFVMHIALKFVFDSDGEFPPPASKWIDAAVISVLSGIAFAWIMYAKYMKPAAEKLWRLRSQVHGKLEPLTDARTGQCPTCGAENASRMDERSWIVKHYLWNPGLAFNELVLGQRSPKVTQTCKECGTGFVDCPSCEHAIDNFSWTARDAFKNWNGLPCPRCGEAIPCLRNHFAGLLIRVFPALERKA